MKKHLACFIIVASLTAASLEAQESLLIKNVNIIPMTHKTVLYNLDILIEEDRIVSISRSGDASVSNKVKSIDGTGKYLLPGLIEMHVHIREKEILREYLKHGFTTVRNMNGNFGDPLKWKEEIENRTLISPDLYTSSPTIIGCRHAQAIRPNYEYAIRTSKEARKWVNKYKESGYDLIKIFRLESLSFFALIDEARKVGIPVSGHLPDINIDGDSIDYADITVEQSIQSGMGIEHAVEFIRAAFLEDQSELRMNYIIEILKQNETTISTLLGNDYRYEMLRNHSETFLTDSLLQLTKAYYGDDGIAQLRSIIKDQPDVDLDEKNSFNFVLSVLNRFNDEGVNIVIGTDSHSTVNIAGHSSLQELFFLSQAGFSNYDVLRAGTFNAAKALFTNDIGTIEVGRKANLLLLNENPLMNLETLRSPEGIVLKGKWLTSESLTLTE